MNRICLVSGNTAKKRGISIGLSLPVADRTVTLAAR